VTLAIAGTALGCGWSLLTEHSVRFNAFRKGRDFYRLPPLPIMYDNVKGKEVTVQAQMDLSDYEGPFRESEEHDPVPPKAPGDDTWDELQLAIPAIDLVKARLLIEKYLDETEPETAWENVRERRNAAHDMLDALTALKQGSKPAAVKIYLDARNTLWFQTSSPGTEELIEQAANDRNLKDNADYLRAALLSRQEKKEDALSAFEQHVVKYPYSEKNEAALYMIAKLKMEASYSFSHEDCGIEGKDLRDEELDPSVIEPKEKCQDENWNAALETFRSLMQKYPRGRYYDDARGWLAFLYKRGGERVMSLAEYYRMLGHPTKRAVRIEAKKSLQIIGHEYDDATLDGVEELIADDVNTSLAYSYHRIYNHAIDLTTARIDPWCCYGENEGQQRRDEETRVKNARESGRRELSRIAAFTTAMMKRYPNSRVSGGFVVRVAEANLESENYADAQTFASKALSVGVRDDLRAEALWIKGSAEHHQNNLRHARSTFQTLISEFPMNRLTEGAQRLLAMTAEDQGDLESALEHYIALKYRYDVAYIIDVLMTTERLARFVDGHPNHAEHNRLLYALGIRYMREGRWNEARLALRKVRTETGESENYWKDDDDERTFAKEPFWDRDEPFVIKTSWVVQDLKTIDVLENMELWISNAPDDEAKAEAMYQQASYLFAADDLLFYNPAAWRGMRAELLNELQFSDSVRKPVETQMILEHSQSHDTMARAISIYLDTANRFPNTKAGKDALYSAAVAHERLSDLNYYWRRVYEMDLFAGPRMVTYADVKSRYPKYQLPRGTDGWEPATRTVNGGPGWAAPEKPKPRETRERKVKRLAQEFTDYISTRITTGVLPKVESKVSSGMHWYSSIIETAVYGILSAIGLWAIFLVGFEIHSRRRSRCPALPVAEERADGNSRVDKMIE